MNLWPVEHFSPHFLTGHTASQSKSVQLYRSNILQNPYFSNFEIYKWADLLANLGNSTSEKEIIEHAFTTDRNLRRAQVIVDWLEYNARKGNWNFWIDLATFKHYQ